MNKNKILKYCGGLVVIAAVFLLGSSFGRGYKTPDKPIVQEQHQTATARLMIDNGSGKVQTMNDIPIAPGATIFDVLKIAAEKNNIDLKYKDYGGDLGIFIESIGGIGKDPAGKKWWQYWVNNKYSQVGVSSYKVQPGDTIEFKFIQGQE